MAGNLPTADNVLAVVRALIGELGADAFRTDGRVQLYSGPRRVIKLALPEIRDNQKRAKSQAKRSHLTMIDDTRVSQHLGNLDKSGSVYRYFDRHYGKGSTVAFLQADKVLREASREFIKAAFGHVATAVCGAATDRIFYEIELPAMVENDAIETINGLPAGMVREFYRLDPYEAFRLICMAELLEARRLAGAANYSRPRQQAKRKRDYRERRSFFISERRATTNLLCAMPADETLRRKLAKQQILARYKMMDHVAAIIDVEPLPPLAVGSMRRVHAGMPHGII